jgi:hypothetical protein
MLGNQLIQVSKEDLDCFIATVIINSNVQLDENQFTELENKLKEYDNVFELLPTGFPVEGKIQMKLTAPYNKIDFSSYFDLNFEEYKDGKEQSYPCKVTQIEWLGKHQEEQLLEWLEEKTDDIPYLGECSIERVL